MNKNIEKKINSAIDELIKGIKKGHTEEFIEFIKIASKFHKYSLNNMLLIYSQMPKAERVAGFVTWKKLGFKVKKGSKAIDIIARKEYVYILRGDEKIFYNKMTDEEKKNLKEHRILAKYDMVKVFDISQVEGDKEKLNFFKPLGNDSKDMYKILKNIVENEKIEVIETTETKGAEGISMGGKILIKQDIDYNNKLLTLIHEFAHEMLDKGENSDRDKTNSKIRELRAETISYIVADYIGVRNPFTVDYILSYGNNEEDLKNHLEKIMETSNKIIRMISEC